MKILSVISVFLVFLALSIGSGLGTEEGTEDTQQIQQPPPQLESSPDVVTDFFFPNITSNRAVGGEPIEVLMTFTNNGEGSFKVATISASIRHPLDYRYFIQNFTTWEYGSIVAPKEEMSFSYVFFPWELEERDYFLVLTVEYQDLEDRFYQTAFYNSTFMLTEPPVSVDGKTFFTYCGIITALILVGFIVYKSRSSTHTKQVKRGKAERGNKGEKVSADNEWLVGTPTYQFAISEQKQKTKKRN